MQIQDSGPIPVAAKRPVTVDILTRNKPAPGTQTSWPLRIALFGAVLVALVSTGALAGASAASESNAVVTRYPQQHHQPRYMEAPRADLRLRKLYAHWVHADASRSRDPDGDVEFYRFWVTDMNTGEIVIAPIDGDGPHRYFALGPGRFRVHARVTDNDGATDVTSEPIVIGSDVRVTASGAICSSSRLASRDLVTCTLTTERRALTALRSAVTADISAEDDELPTDSYTIDRAELAAAAGADDTNVMWFRAFGARGGNGSTYVGSGGDGGNGGYAVTITSVLDFQNTYGTTTIHYYVGEDGSHNGQAGGSGGASTLILTTASTSPTLSQVVLIAGGGGGGGGIGGDIAGSYDEVYPGGDGIGGFGGSNSYTMPGWINASVNFSDGNGGEGDSGGGGGYGGGGGGGEKLGGAGGGGSYAAASTQRSQLLPASCYSSNSNGTIQVFFEIGTE